MPPPAKQYFTPSLKKEKDQNCWLSMVIKRGEQQRFETEKLQYKAVKKEDEEDLEKNKQKYLETMQDLGQEIDISID